MNRRAILIESSQLQGKPDLPGARIDVENWKTFLQTFKGGAWNADEIITFSMPSWSVLHEALLKEKTTPYVFITFSGHGLHLKGKGLEESHICLNDKENIPVNAINPGNPRCTFVFDACRQLILKKGLTETFAANEMILSSAYEDREKYRQLFDAAVKQAEQGIIQLFSCDIDEAANESPIDGGYYTNELMRCCRTWHDRVDQGHRYYYSIWNAHSCATTQTNNKSPQQHPKYNGGRRNKHFPIAIKP